MGADSDKPDDGVPQGVPDSGDELSPGSVETGSKQGISKAEGPSPALNPENEKVSKKHQPSAEFKRRQWKKGQSGNPKGRPVGSVNLTNRIRMAVEQVVQKATSEDERDKTVGDLLVESAIEAAKKGNHHFFKEIIARTDGKVADHVIIESTKRVIAEETQRVAADLLDIVEKKASEYLADKDVAEFLVAIADEMDESFGDADESGLAEDVA